MESFASTTEAYNDFLNGNLLPITVSTKQTKFSGRIRAAESEGLYCFDITATDHVAQRTERDIRATDSGDFYKLNMVLTNSCTILQDGREAVLEAGDLCIYDTTRPYMRVNSPETRMIVLMFPRSILPLPPSSVRDITAVRLDGREGLWRIVSATLTSLVEHFEQIATPTGRRLAHNVIDIVSTLLIDTIQGKTSGGSSNLLHKLCEYIEENLSDPNLSLGTVAAAHYVSKRLIQAQFQRKSTTITAWIRNRRLEMCRRDLSDPLLAGEPVFKIAAMWGFLDPSYFSRIFKTKYGCSPTSFRGEYSAAA